MAEKYWHVKPYMGEKPYIFAGYSFSDQRRVYPSIAYLYKSGFRIWYDSADSSENADMLSRFERSAVYMAFISESFLQEHRMRQQINQALLQKKMLAAVILEPLILPPVLKMQLAAGQVFGLCKEESMREYYKKLVQSDVFLPCKNPRGTEKTTEEKLYQEEPAAAYALWHKNSGKRIPLSKEVLQIGRSQTECDYVITDNLAVSRVHAVLTVRDGICYLIDPCSTNHIYLNGFPLKAGEEYTLKMSDCINIGGEIFVLEKCPAEGDKAL